MPATNSLTLSQQQLREIFDYHPDGHLIYKRSARRVKAGQRAGTLHTKGFIRIIIAKRHYTAHSLIYIWHHGHHPQEGVWHLNRNLTDNRIENLTPYSPDFRKRPTGHRGRTYVSTCWRTNPFAF